MSLPARLHTLPCRGKSIRSLFCVAVFLVRCPFPALADNIITNVISAVVSYQYSDDISSEALTNGGIASPVVSYQYPDDVGAESLAGGGLISPVASYRYYDLLPSNIVPPLGSPTVSYFYELGISNVNILDQPLSQFVQPYGPAMFSVVADGEPPLTYQWLFNGIPLVGQNSSTLLLAGVQAANLGDYSVIVSNSFGSLTSEVAQLILLVPTNRIPTGEEIGLGTIPTNSQLEVFANGAFRTNAPVFPDRMTIVLTHGWNDSPKFWPTAMANLFVQESNNLVVPQPNIVAWDWSKAAASPWYGFEWVAAGTLPQGRALGQALLAALGPNYSEPIHFIGHSFGTLVNAEAADYLHGNASGPPPVVADGAFSWTNTQMTLLDEAELPADPLGWKAWVGYIANAAFAKVFGQPQPPAPFYFKPLPKHAAWVDNYISALGLPDERALNVVLTNWMVLNASDYDTWWSLIQQFHGYPELWYDRSIVQPTGGVVGNRWSFERNTLFLAPPTNSAFFQTITNSELDLSRTSVQAASKWIHSLALLELAEGVDLKETYIATILAEGEISYVGQTAAAIRSGFVTDAYIVSAAATAARSMLISLTTQVGKLASSATRNSAGGESGGMVTNTPAYLWIPLNVPSDALSMSFDFILDGDGQNDSFAVALGGTNVLLIRLDALETNSLMNSGLIDVATWSGKPSELFLGIVGGSSTNATVTVSNIRFYSVLPASLELQATATDILLAWPLWATNYVLEATDDLAATNSWAEVTNIPSIVDFQNLISVPIAHSHRFYRLRRQ